MVASYCVHHGEEPMISGARGSGTIFFSHCCLKCVYCQNYKISQKAEKAERDEKDEQELTGIMLELQDSGVHNINLVSPTHYGVQILEALKSAREQGLKLPIVYNTGGYDSIELIKEFKGLIDIFMPDLKYFDDEKAFKYSGVRNYVETAKAGIAEMFRQSDLLVRHLVLPNNLSDSFKVLDYLAALSKDLWVSLMAQYSPPSPPC